MVEAVPIGAVSGDIAAGLRALADRVDAGEYPNLQFVAAISVDRGGAFKAFAWGPCSNLEAIGAFARAVSWDLVNAR